MVVAINYTGLDFVGIDVPLRFKIGQLIDIAVAIVDDAGTAVNITGRTYTADIIQGGSSIASFTQINTDLVNGLFNYQLTTSGLSSSTVGDARWEAWEDSNRLLWSGPVEILAKETP